MNKIIPTKCIVCEKKTKKLFSYRSFTYTACTSCSHVSTLPYPTTKDMEKHYAKKFIKGNYELLQNFRSQYNEIYKGMIVVLEKQLHKEGKTLKGLSILDVGCFTGEFLLLLKEKGADVYGLELQKDAVRIANKSLPGRVKKADVMHDPFPKKRFDIIALLGVVEHVTDPILLLKQSHKLLKPNGFLLIQTPNSASFLAKTFGKYWPPFEPVEHIHLFGEKSMKIALKNTHFALRSFQPHWKKLPIQYVYNMLENFGPEIHKIIKPFHKIFSKIPKNVALPFYIGEMLIVAKKVPYQKR